MAEWLGALLLEGTSSQPAPPWGYDHARDPDLVMWSCCGAGEAILHPLCLPCLGDLLMSAVFQGSPNLEVLNQAFPPPLLLEPNRSTSSTDRIP
ncbi:hypothetical protein SKAU_G00214820 [Synaphobranchus kaupii]|uniref:Uncharacterized protein n=1 Tax=Synaphobranchus kaupii TaxID=118154 RepID=A0A9Q1F9T9_SYNKA|nr:hypothetical protein SKAU_G00214820 [Synaphobranchus kaupii]